MSGKRIVELCEHGETERHLVHGAHTLRCYCTQTCDGGRTLTEGQYVLIEKTDGEWPEWAIEAGRLSVFAGWLRGIEALDPHPRNEDDLASIFLDALSDHTEGTP